MICAKQVKKHSVKSDCVGSVCGRAGHAHWLITRYSTPSTGSFQKPSRGEFVKTT